MRTPAGGRVPLVARVGIGRLPGAVYESSKGGLEGDHTGMAAQWSRFDIRFDGIGPGFFGSEITRDVIDRDNVQVWILRNTLIPGTVNPPKTTECSSIWPATPAHMFTGLTIVVAAGTARWARLHDTNS